MTDSSDDVKSQRIGRVSAVGVVPPSATEGDTCRCDDHGSYSGAEPDVSNYRHFPEEGNALKTEGNINCLSE